MAKRILMVDDSAVVRGSLRAMLEDDRAGLAAHCEEAPDGSQAIAKARQIRPDLIVLDLSMPVMNGLEAARELKRIFPEVPIIMYTSYASDALRDLALAAGIKMVVDKTHPDNLLLAIHASLKSAA